MPSAYTLWNTFSTLSKRTSEAGGSNRNVDTNGSEGSVFRDSTPNKGYPCTSLQSLSTLSPQRSFDQQGYTMEDTPVSISVCPSLLTLPKELLYAIFKLLDKPSKISLALSAPYFIHSFAAYYDLDRYRRNDEGGYFRRKIGLPHEVSWQDSRAQGAIIRWIAIPGCDDIDEPPEPPLSEEEQRHRDQLVDGLYELDDIESGKVVLPKTYEDTKEGKEEVTVQATIADWMKTKCGIQGGVVFCGECYRHKSVLRPDGKKDPWVQKMLTRPT